MEHYVTLFNSHFLPQGLALHASLEQHAGPYTLWVICVDDETHRVLSKLAPANLRTIQLSSVETPELSRVRPTRSIAEYCWTLTPFAPRFVFEADATVDRVTYLDADLYLLRSPAPIFDGFKNSGKQVLITDHAYAPEHDWSAISGRFCVQFMSFQRGNSEKVRKWWEERCVEWCYSRAENGKFGDQKYLDDWPERFPELIYIPSDEGRFLAPWNATRFPYSLGIVFHFHGLRLLPERKVLLTEKYLLPEPLVCHVYQPYLITLDIQLSKLAAIGFSVPHQDQLGLGRRLKGFFRGIWHQRWQLKTLRVGSLVR